MRVAMAYPLTVIPVLDLQDGQVVHARRGERARYAPMRSPLAAGSEPLALARALLRRSGAQVLYVADLDAIGGAALQTPVLRQLLHNLPGVTLWLDGGFASVPALQAALAPLGDAAQAVRPVFGTESLHPGARLAACPQAVLSLDSRAGQPLDPAGLWARPEHWPDTLVLMSLDQVGAAQGPALALLAEQRARKPQAQWVGAGGVRHRADLALAAQAGAAAWLVATALHDGSLQGAE